MVVKTLVSRDVDTIFGLPGTHILSVYDALRDETSITPIMVMHEVSSAIMADAYGRLTGKTGVCITTAGPGATNAVTGIATAYTESSPVVQISGHCDTIHKIQPFHGVDDWDFLRKIYEPITKWSTRVEHVDDIPLTLNKAFDLSLSGRPGPVHIEIPRDIVNKKSSTTAIQSRAITKKPVDIPKLNRIIEALKESKYPLIAVGRGVLRSFCSLDVIDLGEKLGAPLLTLRTALDAFSYDCPIYPGYDMGGGLRPFFESLLKEADLILTLGFDFGERISAFSDYDTSVIHVHQDSLEKSTFETKSQESASIIDYSGNIKDTVRRLSSEIKTRINGKKKEKTAKKIANIKNQIEDDVKKSIAWGSQPIHLGELCTELRRLLERDAIITLGVGVHSAWASRCCHPYEPNTLLSSGRYGSMDFALPASIAAKTVFPHRQVVALTGDGSFLMGNLDFPTAVKYGLNIKVIVSNDSHYGMIWLLQKMQYEERTFSTELKVPDLVQYAESFGAKGFRVEDPKELPSVLEEAINLERPVIVDVMTDFKYPLHRPFLSHMRKPDKHQLPS